MCSDLSWGMMLHSLIVCALQMQPSLHTKVVRCQVTCMIADFNLIQNESVTSNSLQVTVFYGFVAHRQAKYEDYLCRLQQQLLAGTQWHSESNMVTRLSP